MIDHVTLRAEDGLDCIATIVDEITYKPIYGSLWAQNKPHDLCVAEMTREEVLLSAYYQREIVLAARDKRVTEAIERMRER